MESSYRKKILDNFIELATRAENRAELFAIENGCAKTSFFNNYRIILRSTEVEYLFKKIVKSIKNNKKSQGFIYFLHQQELNGSVIPLYLGIARREGKKKETSSLLNSNYPRWGYYKGGNFHLSNLNSVLFTEGYTAKDSDKNYEIYIKWAENIFNNPKFPVPHGEQIVPRKPTYLSLIEWGENQNSFVDILGKTSIKCEESILINLLYEYYPEKLLNNDI